MKYSKLTLITATALTVFFLSCKKEEGPGGKATIKGYITIKEYEYNDVTGNFDFIPPEYTAAKEDVYIVYGNNDVYDDDMETNYDGLYEFNWLRPGDYKIFAYSEDTSDSYRPPSLISVEASATINSKKQTVVVPTITIVRVVR